MISLKENCLILFLVSLAFLSEPILGLKTDIRTMEIYGDAGLGYYYMNVFVGDSMSKQSLIIDTGSSLMAFPCKSCSACGVNHFNNPYNFEKTQGHKPFTNTDSFAGWTCHSGNAQGCDFGIHYVEGSGYNGHLILDYVYFPDELPRFEVDRKKAEIKEKYRAISGCIESETGEFYKQKADGIIGLGVGTNCKIVFISLYLSSRLDISFQSIRKTGSQSF